MQAAYNKVKERGDVVVDIYPELYEEGPRSNAPRNPAPKPHRRKSGGRTK